MSDQNRDATLNEMREVLRRARLDAEGGAQPMPSVPEQPKALPTIAPQPTAIPASPTAPSMSKLPFAATSMHTLPFAATSVPVVTLSARFGQVLTFCKSPAILAVITFVAMMVIFFAIKPGFCSVEVEDPDATGIAKRKLNLKVATLTAGVCSGLVLIVPYLIKWRMAWNVVQVQQVP